MSTQAELERCLAFVNCQLQPGPGQRDSSDGRIRAVTISRQSGCGAHVIAEKLAALLQGADPEHAAWAIFDRDLVEKVLQDHHLPERLAKFMSEDRISEMDDILDELFGLHPNSWILVWKTAETILHLAQLGKVILIGRGANVITFRQPQVLHVRLVGSLECRLARVQQFDGLTRKQANDLIRRQDAGRKRYVRKYFKQNIEDPLLYHLGINTDLLDDDQAARIIAEAAAAPPNSGVCSNPANAPALCSPVLNN